MAFLDQIKPHTERLFLLGDLFDFWYEYRTVVPKGYVRILGKLAEFTDAGIPVDFFVGNHDMWMKDYFQQELQVKVHFKPVPFTLDGKSFLIGHGDGLGPGDQGYKMIKRVFRNPVAQWMFGMLPPRIGIGLAGYFSRRSRLHTGSTDQVFLGEEKEWLIRYCREVLKETHFDFFVFGHRHLPLDVTLNEKSRYLNLGDWITYDSYAVFDGEQLSLAYHRP